MAAKARLFRNPSPRARGFRMPAEWERHEATWLVWPRDPDTWPGVLEKAEEAICEFATVVARGETVHLLVADKDCAERAAWCLNANGARRVVLHRIQTQDAWIRDYGPLVVARGKGARRERIALDFRFNAWGRKYRSLEKDTDVPKRLKRIHGLPTESTRLVLEGGSIDVNGRGTLLTTEQCLLNPNRNPSLTREEVELHLRELLGVRHILWLGDGIEGDDTDGHIDDIARFVDPTTVVAAVEENRRDANYGALRDNLRRLRAMADQDGTPLTVVPLPMPAAIESRRGHRLPASYLNFYIANRVVCVPTFGDPNDRRALAVLRRLFPKRKVVGIRCEHLVEGMGTLHCLSQQLPA
ncbi:MAG: agmatine deiminase family protein [Planctomycetota bacterium]|nr:agmatine deiminase family protein [Planctomycetota bacterium]